MKWGACAFTLSYRQAREALRNIKSWSPCYISYCCYNHLQCLCIAPSLGLPEHSITCYFRPRLHGATRQCAMRISSTLSKPTQRSFRSLRQKRRCQFPMQTKGRDSHLQAGPQTCKSKDCLVLTNPIYCLRVVCDWLLHNSDDYADRAHSRVFYRKRRRRSRVTTSSLRISSYSLAQLWAR